MTVGKPNFNLNSFGVKYLSKDEVQEFLEKRRGDKIGTQVEVPNKLTPQGKSCGRSGLSSTDALDTKNKTQKLVQGHTNRNFRCSQKPWTSFQKQDF